MVEEPKLHIDISPKRMWGTRLTEAILFFIYRLPYIRHLRGS